MTDEPQACRVCLTITELRCASEGASLERSLKKLEGVRDATVNPLVERIWMEVDRLPRLESIVRLVASRGYSVDISDVRMTTWISGSPARLAEMRCELSSLPNVTYYGLGRPTGRVELGLALGAEWEKSLRDVCARLCEAPARSETDKSEVEERTAAIMIDRRFPEPPGGTGA